MTADDVAPAAEATDQAETTEVEMAAEVEATATTEAAPAAEPAPVAAEPAAPAVEPAKAADPAPVPAPFDWKAIAGDDADALKLLGDFKTPADLIAEIKKGKADWRDEFAQGDDKTKEWLKRFTDKSSFMKSVNSLRSKVGDKALVKVPDDKSSPEEWSEWRKAVGIPETPAGYKLNLPKDADQSDIAKAIRENYVAVMHKAGATQAQIDAGLAADMAREEMVAKHMAKLVQEASAETEENLRAKWVGDYRPNMEAANRFFGSMKDYGIDDFLNLQLKSGARLGDFQPMIEWAAEQGRMMYGAAAFESGEPMDAMSLDQEWNKYMGMVGTDEYSKPHVQKRVNELNRMRNRMKGRAA